MFSQIFLAEGSRWTKFVAEVFIPVTPGTGGLAALQLQQLGKPLNIAYCVASQTNDVRVWREFPRSEIEIDECTGISLAQTDGNDPTKQHGHPYQLRPRPAHRVPDQAMVVEPMKCREHDDQENGKDVLG
jgi:hypothetical protein